MSKLVIHLARHQDSKLFQRLQDPALRSMVNHVADNATPLLTQVVRHMPLFTLHEYRAAFRKLSGAKELFVLLSPEDLYLKPFADWTPLDWAHPHHLSFHYDNTTGETLLHEGGVITREEIRRTGRPYFEVVNERPTPPKPPSEASEPPGKPATHKQ